MAQGDSYPDQVFDVGEMKDTPHCLRASDPAAESTEAGVLGLHIHCEGALVPWLIGRVAEEVGVQHVSRGEQDSVLWYGGEESY